MCCDDYPNASFRSGTQAIGYARAVFFHLGATADAIFAAETAKEVVLISRVFPALSEEYLRNKESLQWEIFTWKFQNVPAFERRLRESGEVTFTSHGGTATGIHGNWYGRLLTTFRDQMLDEGAMGLCYRSNRTTPTADTHPCQTITAELWP